MTRVRDSTDPLQLVLALDVPASYFASLRKYVFVSADPSGEAHTMLHGETHADR
jgi:hypothetical protein